MWTGPLDLKADTKIHWLSKWQISTNRPDAQQIIYLGFGMAKSIVSGAWSENRSSR